MFDLLIAEDEEIERNYLKSMIEKAGFPLQNIYLAENGQEAVDLYRQHTCDIILMDINMPLKSGLQALSEIRKLEVKESICFIITSYDYFQYAKEAIHLHVEDFILKPADIDIVMECISMAVEKLKKNRNQFLQTYALVERINKTKPLLEKECANLILTGQDAASIQKHLKLLDIHFQSGFCVVLNKEHTTQEILMRIKQEIEDLGVSILATMMKNHIVYFVIANRSMKLVDVDHILAVFKQFQHLTYGSGSIQQDLESFYQSYTHALMDEQSEAQNESGGIVQLKQKLQHKISEMILDLENDDDFELKEKIKELAVECMQKENEEQGSGKTYLDDFMNLLIEKLQQQYGITMHEIDFDLDFQHTSRSIVMELSYKLHNVLRSAKLMKYQQLDYLSKGAIEYIKANYMNQISLNDLAEVMNVSPSHLSRVLSNNNERGFSDIVNDYRIKEAKRLIRKGVILKDVAFRVGFRSQSYFAKAFKKAVGMSPKEYRNLF